MSRLWVGLAAAGLVVLLSTGGTNSCLLYTSDAADRLENARPGEVLGGDQFDLTTLALELSSEQPGDVGVDLGEPGGLQVLERLLGDCHRRPS